MTFDDLLNLYKYSELDHRNIKTLEYIKPKHYSKFKAFFDKNRGHKFCINVDSDGDGAVCTKLARYMLIDFEASDIKLMFQAIPHTVGEEMVDYCKENDLVAVILDSSSNNRAIMESFEMNNVPAIIIDHHKLEKGMIEYYETLNVVTVITNETEYEELRDLSCGMYLYFLMHFYYEDYGKNAREYFDLGVLSLTSDVCPMDKQYHRSIMKKYIENKDRNYFISSYTDKYNDFNSSLLAMHITPRINALFRTNSYALLNSLILDENLEELRTYVNDLYKTNKRILSNVMDQLTIYDYGNIMYAEIMDYPVEFIAQKYTGLLANKIVERYRKPCIVTCNIGNGISKGSIRSKVDLNINETLKNSKHIIKSGGHTLAHGFTLKREYIEEIIYTFNDMKSPTSERPYISIDSLNDIVSYFNILKEIADFNEYSGSNVEPIGFRYKVKPYDEIEDKVNYSVIESSIRVVAFTPIQSDSVLYITPRNSMSGVQFIAQEV